LAETDQLSVENCSVIVDFVAIGPSRRNNELFNSTPQKKAQSRISEKIWYVVNWSPEQISGWLAANRNLQINHERIYQEENVMAAMTGVVRAGTEFR
jgi:hypothetical protein